MSVEVVDDDVDDIEAVPVVEAVVLDGTSVVDVLLITVEEDVASDDVVVVVDELSTTTKILVVVVEFCSDESTNDK